jgi:type IV pilus assembly protein PilW
VQRASTCTTADAGAACVEVPTQAYLQVSECGNEYNGTPFVLALGGDASLKLQTRACDGTPVVKRRFIRRFFYVDANDVLSYVDITPFGPSAPVPIVENIEQMQVEYGIDADGDGTPERFAPTAADWTQVIGTRVWLLARSTDPSGNTRAATSFEMSDTVVDIAAATRNPKRRVYSTFIPFVTPKSRREF